MYANLSLKLVRVNSDIFGSGKNGHEYFEGGGWVIKNERGEANIGNPDETVHEPSHLDFKCLNHMSIFSGSR